MNSNYPRPNHHRKRPSNPRHTSQPNNTNPITYSPLTPSSTQTHTSRRHITPPIVSSTPGQQTIPSSPRQPVLTSNPRHPTVSSTLPTRPHPRPRLHTQPTNRAQEPKEKPASTTPNSQPAFPRSPISQQRSEALPPSSPVEQPPSEALSLSPFQPTFSRPSNAQGHGGSGGGEQVGQGENEGVEKAEAEPIPSTGDSFCDHYGRTTTRTNNRKLEFLEEYARTGVWGQWKGI